MPSHYTDMGFYANSIKDVKHIIENLPEPQCRIETPNGIYQYTIFDNNIEFWILLDAQDNILNLDFHYNNKHAVPVKMLEWLTDDDGEYTNTIKVSYPQDKPKFPIIVDVPNAELHRALKREDKFMLQIACFAETMTVSHGDSTLSRQESYVPIGAFAASDEDTAAANASLCAHILDFEQRQNSMDGGMYYVITVRCQDALFDVIADASYIDIELRKGAIIEGTFWMSGKILRI